NPGCDCHLSTASGASWSQDSKRRLLERQWRGMETVATASSPLLRIGRAPSGVNRLYLNLSQFPQDLNGLIFSLNVLISYPRASNWKLSLWTESGLTSSSTRFTSDTEIRPEGIFTRMPAAELPVAS